MWPYRYKLMQKYISIFSCSERSEGYWLSKWVNLNVVHRSCCIYIGHVKYLLLKEGPPRSIIGEYVWNHGFFRSYSSAKCQIYQMEATAFVHSDVIKFSFPSYIPVFVWFCEVEGKYTNTSTSACARQIVMTSVWLLFLQFTRLKQ